MIGINNKESSNSEDPGSKQIKMRRKILVFLGFAVIVFVSLNWSASKPVLKNGIWRTTLQRPDGQTIVFNFETKDSAGKKILYVLNAGERLLVDNVRMAGDSVFIQMPFFESGFKAVIDEDGNLRGLYIKKLADRDQVMPFKAVYNEKHRFSAKASALYNVSGKWAVKFLSLNTNITTQSVGEFEQVGNRLSGTFLTSSGDYRYLEGIVSGDSLMLSGFDGGHAFLFKAKIENNNFIAGGRFYSGYAGVENWVALKDPGAMLPDGYDDTKLRPGETSLNFRFKSIEGKDVSIKDEVFKGKVVVVQIMGSWCPNCMDETRFLSEYYQKNKKRGVEIVALAYERTTDFERSAKSLKAFQKRFNVKYPILYTGVTLTDSFRTEKTLPQLETIKAFPTSIFIDKKGNVAKIYTGFMGPGTGNHYNEFVKEFDETITALLNE